MRFLRVWCIFFKYVFFFIFFLRYLIITDSIWAYPIIYFFLNISLAAHQEALKREIERLREVYQQQSLKKMENGNHSQATGTGANSAVDIKPSNEKEELFNVW